jgi:hypothetical protein
MSAWEKRSTTRESWKCRIVIQGDLGSGRRDAHEVADVTAAHGEPDRAGSAVPEHPMKLELGRVERAEDPFIEAPDVVLAHRFRRIAVQADVVVVEREIPIQISGIPARLSG